MLAYAGDKRQSRMPLDGIPLPEVEFMNALATPSHRLLQMLAALSTGDYGGQ